MGRWGLREGPATLRGMELTERDDAMLHGEFGGGVRLAMSLLVTMAEIQDAPGLIDITGAHIDSCLYHGRAGLDFAEAMAQDGTTVSVPTTLNVSSLDLLHPELYRGNQKSAAESRRQMDAYVAMGCRPTWTCSPYQLSDRPSLGQQVAWGESNAIVFANSVLGARTERYGDFMDMCCAVTGRAPYVGLHTDSGRRATVVVELRVTDEVLDADLSYPLLGGVVGTMTNGAVVAITGLDERADEDRLKAFGAAAASTGSTAMFHAVGVTPEAPTLSTVTLSQPNVSVTVDLDDLKTMFQSFDRDQGPLGAISIGTPHFSEREFAALDMLIGGRRSAVPFLINTGRDVLSAVEPGGVVGRLRAFGATIVTDTCVYITPILGDINGVMMTNSGKAAFYAPGNLGVGVAFGSLEDCVESAVAGRVVRTGVWS